MLGFRLLLLLPPPSPCDTELLTEFVLELLLGMLEEVPE
jgi:hypothetical protein